MPPPKKNKVQMAEPTGADGTDVSIVSGINPEQQLAVEAATAAAQSAAPAAMLPEGAGGKRMQAAIQAWKDAYTKAFTLRAIAKKYQEKEALAKKLFERKMARLDAGDKGFRTQLYGAV